MLPVAAVVVIKMKTRKMTMMTKTTTATATATTLWCFSKFWPMTSPLLGFPDN
jgi:hypothetical protein